jgi:hypothetical protein
MSWGNREREQETRDAKLQDMERQVSTGALVIRHMTASERARYAREREKHDASMTPAQRARCEGLLRARRRRATFLAEGAADTDQER